MLDLDTLPKATAFPDLALPKTPFTFRLAGVDYELMDPRDADWKMAYQLANNPFLLMRTSLVGADEPITYPTPAEIAACRERHGMIPEPPAEGSPEAEEEAKNWPDGPPAPALIDRFTAAHLPGWKMNALFARWHEHFKIDLSAGKGILGTLLGTTD